MRTKTILLTAAVLAAGLGASVAQSVFSVNAVGYVNLALHDGYNLVCNPLNAPTNKIGVILTTLPNFSTLLKWNESTHDFDIAVWSFGSWGQDEMGNELGEISLAPGEGAFIQLGAGKATNVVFVGDVLQGNLTNQIPVGYSIRSSKVPQTAGVTALGVTGLANFTSILKWNGSDYDLYSYQFGGWTDPNGDPNEPTIAVGESFFFNASGARQWVRTFSVN